ncbi:MAG: methionyl-tRNA formyltransferase [Brachybacterium sp.]|nr:methionyl-tRNA formyltransferase [Brachybacterium sp.]
MRLLFAGTPETAVPSLRVLLEDERHDVVGVLTRPDAPSGRGRRLRPSPIRQLAEHADVPVLTPTTLRDPAVARQIRALAPDVAPVVAYGQLVPAEALDIPPHGWVNLHFSLLPSWRGAAPVQRAILAGQSSTGLTTFRLDEGLDTGDVLRQQPVAIDPLATSGDLLEELAERGARLLASTLADLADGSATATAQSELAGEPSHAAKLRTAEAAIDWHLPAEQVSAHIRGMSPAPGAWTTLHGARMKILGITVDPATDPQLPDLPALAPGALYAGRRTLHVGTGTTPIALGTLAPAGKKAMAAADWARGANLGPEDTFTTPAQETTA